MTKRKWWRNVADPVETPIIGNEEEDMIKHVLKLEKELRKCLQKSYHLYAQDIEILLQKVEIYICENQQEEWRKNCM